MTTSTDQPRVPGGRPTGGRFAHTTHGEAALTLDHAPATAAAVLASAKNTDLDFTTVDWPAPPPYLEVCVDAEEAANVLDNNGYDGAELTAGYLEVYAYVNPVLDNELDLYGEDSRGSSELLATGVHNWENLVDTTGDTELRLRFDRPDPMPEYRAAYAESEAARTRTAEALLETCGVEVKADDYRRQQHWLHHGGRRLRLEARYYPPRLIETTWWRIADEAQLEEFFGGPVTEEQVQLLANSARLVTEQMGRDHRAAQR